MRLIKRKILIEDLYSRNPDVTYGLMTASTIYIPIFLTQTFDDIGINEDMEYKSSNLTFTMTGDTHNVRQIGVDVSGYYTYGGLLSGFSSSKLSECQNYGVTQYLPGFDVESEVYDNFLGISVDGRTRVFDFQPNGVTKYTIKGDISDPNFGTNLQSSGLYFEDNNQKTRRVVNVHGNYESIIETKFTAFNEGFNKTNTSLSAITKLEEYLGVVFPPEIQSDVFIERGENVIFEPHLKLSEIESVNHLMRFGNGYYNIIKQNI